MISYFRWFVDTTILLGAALGLGFWVRGALLGRKAAEKSVGFFPILISLLIVTILWIAPLIFPPDSIFRGDLPPKPLIIAHRGASMVAPENTISSFILAAGLGVYGLETDIHISNDGQPFLLHDDTFVRTTDVEERFPERTPIGQNTLHLLKQSECWEMVCGKRSVWNNQQWAGQRQPDR
jgi:hypothetical protein